MFENFDPKSLVLLVVLLVILATLFYKSKKPSVESVGSHEYEGGYDEENDDLDFE